MHAAALEDLEAAEQEMLLVGNYYIRKRESRSSWRPTGFRGSDRTAQISCASSAEEERATRSLSEHGWKSPKNRRRFSARGPPDGHMAHTFADLRRLCRGSSSWTGLVCDAGSEALPVNSLPGDCPF